MKKNKFAILAGIVIFMAVQNPANAACKTVLIRNTVKCIDYYNEVFNKYPLGSEALQTMFAAKQKTCTKYLVSANERFNKEVVKLEKLNDQHDKVTEQIGALMTQPDTPSRNSKVRKLVLKKNQLADKISQATAELNAMRAKLIELRNLLNKSTS